MINLILNRFTGYLIQERGLTRGTMKAYVRIIRQFLRKRFKKNKIQFSKLKQQDIIRFILRQAYSVSPSYAKNMVHAIRAFLRFLYVRSLIPTNMAVFVPAVAKWRLAGVPETLDVKDVERMLKSCDQQSLMGQRNYAILLILARLGLRAGEVVNMKLDDLQWGTGELIIRGKGNHHDKLPLLQDVGEALAKYIKNTRPSCLTRQVFVCIKAPYHGFTSSGAIYSIVKNALCRAGIHAFRTGPHVLRHSLATRMLHTEVSLPEISRILRHRSLNTTLMYTKVDLPSLRKLAQRWPGGNP
ncbi:MAG: site-specific integrase [bacterium]